MHFTLMRRPAGRTAALLVLLCLAAIPGVALANHQFNDVDANHPFHTDISAIAGAGITAGFNDGGYHPSDPVTRQAMAAFMHRGFGRVGLVVNTALESTHILPPAMALSSPYVFIRQITIEVPGASNAFTPTQLVHLQGRVTLFAAMNTGDGCPCEFEARILEFETNTYSPMQVQTFYSPANGAFGFSFDVEAVFAASPGARTYHLEVRLSNRAAGTETTFFNFDNRSSLSAMTIPFST